MVLLLELCAKHMPGKNETLFLQPPFVFSALNPEGLLKLLQASWLRQTVEYIHITDQPCSFHFLHVSFKLKKLESKRKAKIITTNEAINQPLEKQSDTKRPCSEQVKHSTYDLCLFSQIPALQQH